MRDNGECPRGDKCRFSHEIQVCELQGPAGEEEANAVALPRTAEDFQELSPGDRALMQNHGQIPKGVMCTVLQKHEVEGKARYKVYPDKPLAPKFDEFLRVKGLFRHQLRLDTVADMAPAKHEANKAGRPKYKHRAIGDSGATISIVDDYDLLDPHHLVKLPRPQTVGGLGATKVVVTHKSHLLLCSNIPGCSDIISLPNAYYTSDPISRILVSLSSLDDLGYYTDTGGGGMRVRKGMHGHNILMLPRLREEAGALSAFNPTGLATKGPVDFNIDTEHRRLQPLYPIPDRLFVRANVRNPNACHESHLAAQLQEYTRPICDHEAFLAKIPMQVQHSALGHMSYSMLHMAHGWDVHGKATTPQPQRYPTCTCCLLTSIDAKTSRSRGKIYEKEAMATLAHVSADVCIRDGSGRHKGLGGYMGYLLIYEWHTEMTFTYIYVATQRASTRQAP